MVPHFLNPEVDDVLVPIKIDVTHGDGRFQDSFCWNLYNSCITPEEFAWQTCVDDNLPSELVTRVVAQLQEQIDAFQSLASLVASCDESAELRKSLSRVVADICVRSNVLEYSDCFLWDGYASCCGPEDFARQTCADLGLPAEMQPVIALRLREIVLRWSWWSEMTQSVHNNVMSSDECPLCKVTGLKCSCVWCEYLIVWCDWCDVMRCYNVCCVILCCPITPCHCVSCCCTQCVICSIAGLIWNLCVLQSSAFCFGEVCHSSWTRVGNRYRWLTGHTWRTSLLFIVNDSASILNHLIAILIYHHIHPWRFWSCVVLLLVCLVLSCVVMHCISFPFLVVSHISMQVLRPQVALEQVTTLWTQGAPKGTRKHKEVRSCTSIGVTHHHNFINKPIDFFVALLWLGAVTLMRPVAMWISCDTMDVSLCMQAGFEGAIIPQESSNAAIWL